MLRLLQKLDKLQTVLRQTRLQKLLVVLLEPCSRLARRTHLIEYRVVPLCLREKKLLGTLVESEHCHHQIAQQHKVRVVRVFRRFRLVLLFMDECSKTVARRRASLDLLLPPNIAAHQQVQKQMRGQQRVLRRVSYLRD